MIVGSSRRIIDDGLSCTTPRIHDFGATPVKIIHVTRRYRGTMGAAVPAIMASSTVIGRPAASRTARMAP
jgi:hypothetical protein